MVELYEHDESKAPVGVENVVSDQKELELRNSTGKLKNDDALTNLKVKDGEHEIGAAIQQHNVAAYYDVRTVGW